ncbi:MAG: riboflavin synthase subunit alpha [Actinobacteria bacterium RBG_13_35_12]|jgi:riboflavin synthase|nr:MAG: riboflavin synthase subunit alpha [Actinobacteria bacterium RBG_13_35_12]
MFTGIIKETGRIRKIIDRNGDIEIKIQCRKILEDLDTGDSISVNGVCLTVTGLDNEGFSCDISFNTLNTTSLKYINTGDIINLESSLTTSGKLGGHFVNGHVDCTVKILKISGIGRSYIFNLELPANIRDFVALKGSIAIDGISLTVSEVKNDNFSVVIIPYTYKNTNLSHRKPGDIVNIEVDMIARYTVNFLQSRNIDDTYSRKLKDEILKEKLEKHGFTK